MRICVTLLTLSLLVIAANGAPANTEFTNGTIQGSCAPWDGPAIGITLSAKPLQCGKTPGGPFISVGVWRGLPIHPGQSVNFASISEIGFASRCKKENDCERAESAEITFDTYKEGSSASGHYELHFKDGYTVSGHFDVKWCESRQMCG
jgi:hypothetical protein